MSSFDPADARDFGLDYGGQFFDHAVSNADYVPTTDCFFCGLPKDRTEELSRLKDMLESQGCTCDFVVPQCREECLIGDQYYQRLSRARCLVDIVQKNQCGLTKRPLEALLYRKKLITNNPWVRHEDFYNPHNIFILGEDDDRLLATFVREEPHPVPRNIVERYDVNVWVRQFLP